METNLYVSMSVIARCAIILLPRDRVDYQLWSLKPAILENLFVKNFQGYIIENFIPRKFLAIR